MNLYAYVHNDPVNGIDIAGEEAFYIGFQAGFQVLGFGGRFSVAIGIDTDSKTAFAGYSAGGASDIANPGNAEEIGLQIGAGAGVGVAESSDFVVAPAYTNDIDVLVGSVTVATNDPLLDDKGDISFPAAESPNGDTKIRQLELSFGPGGGSSQVYTSGKKVETTLGPSRDIRLKGKNSPSYEDLTRSIGNPCTRRPDSQLC
jgi:hypothetical protein